MVEIEFKKGKEECEITFPYNYQIIGKIKTISGRKYNPEKKSWAIPNTELDRLKELFPNENVPKSDAKKVTIILEKDYFKTIPENIPVFDKRLYRMLYFKRPKDIFEVEKSLKSHGYQCEIKGFEPRTGFNGFEKLPTPYDFQREGIDFLKNIGSGILSLDTGLGKTPSSLIFAHEMSVSSILVIAPTSLIEQWNDEIKNLFGYIDGVVISGKVPKVKRLEMYENPVVLASYDIIKNDIDDLWKKGIKLHFDLVIMDEVQKVKNYKIERTAGISKVVGKYILGLTATPVENKLEEIYFISDHVVPAYFGGFNDFQKRHFTRDGYGNVTGYKFKDEVHNVIKKIMFRRKKSDVDVQLPEKIEIDRWVELSLKEKQLYNKIFNEGEDLGTLASLKVCASNTSMRGFKGVSAKEKLLKEMLSDELSGRKVIIFTQYKKNLPYLEKITDKLGYETFLLSGGMQNKIQPTIKKFDESENGILIMTEVGTYGLNLQTADVVVNFDLAWNPAQMLQRVGRIERIGSKYKSILIVNMITKNTIDVRIKSLLEIKKELSDATIDGIFTENKEPENIAEEIKNWSEKDDSIQEILLKEVFK